MNNSCLQDEVVVYTAHWDHFGKRGEEIFYGARDNALGVAALLELAKAFTNIPQVAPLPGKEQRESLGLILGQKINRGYGKESEQKTCIEHYNYYI